MEPSDHIQQKPLVAMWSPKTTRNPRFLFSFHKQVDPHYENTQCSFDSVIYDITSVHLVISMMSCILSILHFGRTETSDRYGNDIAVVRNLQTFTV